MNQTNKKQVQQSNKKQRIRTNTLLWVKYIFAVIISIIFGMFIQSKFISNKKFEKPKERIVYKEKIVYKTDKDVILNITRKTLEEDIKNYKDISNDSRKQIIESLFKYSKEYNINPIIIYSIIATESSFKFWIKHSQVTVKDAKGRMVQTRAIGLGGVIYEIWNDKLNFIETKSDLYKIDKNIHAVFGIIKILKEKPLMEGTKTKIESAFLRYFGGGKKNTWYVRKVNAVLSNIIKKELYTKSYIFQKHVDNNSSK